MTTRAPLRRYPWTRITEATVAVDYHDGLNLTRRPYWPIDAVLWRQNADRRDAETLRRLKGITR